MSRADAIIRSRAQLMQALDLNAHIGRDLTHAALSQSSADLDAATAYLAEVDKLIDALTDTVERARIAVADEYDATRPGREMAVAS